MLKEPHQAVREALEGRRQYALETAAAQRAAAYEKAPQLWELDSRMAQTAMEIAAAALATGGVQAVATLQQRIGTIQAERARLLAEQGLRPDDLLPQYSCKDCADTGYVAGQRCSCYRELYCREAGKRLPQQATDGSCAFANFRLELYPERDEKGEPCRAAMQRLATLCAEYAEQVGGRAGNLLFIGKTGLGKTHLSLAIAARVAQRGLLVRYTSAQGLVDCYERTRFNRNPSPDDWDFVQTAAGCDLLVLDDLGSEFVTSFSQSVLYNLINDRMMQQKETVISTNLDPTKLNATYEQRISSRLLCGCKALGFTGKDIRLLKRMG